jgi:hypothetical protein
MLHSIVLAAFLFTSSRSKYCTAFVGYGTLALQVLLTPWNESVIFSLDEEGLSGHEISARVSCDLSLCVHTSQVA